MTIARSFKLLALATLIIPSFAHAKGGVAAGYKSNIVKQMRSLTTVKGSAVYGIKKGSITASNVRFQGKVPKGPWTTDQGAQLRFTIKGLEKPAGQGTFNMEKATGTYMTNSIMGPRTMISKVSPQRAPRAALR